MHTDSHSFSVEKLPEFDDHRLVMFVQDRASGLRGFIAIHRGGERMPALGATRFWRYKNETEALRDALRLSRLMSYKSALAGLPYGGAKGVLMAPSGDGHRKAEILRAYASRVNYLGGHFVTGTDVGLTVKDLETMRDVSRHLIGYKSNPEKFTALGIYFALHVCLKETFGRPSLRGRKIAIQGLGKVGMNLLELLAPTSARLVVSDIDAEKVKEAGRRFRGIESVKPADIHRQEVDVFSPCALSNVLTRKTIAELRCKIVAGGANNQLESPRAGEALWKRGVLYAPDYLINAGGLISVVDEFEWQNHRKDRVIRRVQKIKKRLRTVLDQSRKRGKPTSVIADELAEKVMATYQ